VIKLELLLPAVFTFAVIVRLSLVRRRRIDFDTYGHLYYATAVAEQRAAPWGAIEVNSWAGEKFYHPFLWHKVVGLLPSEWITKNQHRINAVLDAMFLTTTCVFLDYMKLDAKTIVFICLLYLFTPMWFSRVAMGPRVHSLTPRLASEILFNITALVLISHLTQSWTGSAFAVSLIFAQLLISKFSLQVVIFTLPMISIFGMDLHPAVFALAGLGVAIIMSRGKIADLIKRQVTHLTEYYRYNRDGKTSVSNRNGVRQILKKWNSEGLTPKQLGEFLLFQNSYTATALKMPVFVVFLTTILSTNSSAWSPTLVRCLPILMAGTVLYFLTNTKRLLFLGEAERYLNHIGIVIVIATVHQLIENNQTTVLVGLIAYGVIYWILEAVVLEKVFSDEVREISDAKILTLLRSIDPTVVASIPYHNFCVFRVMLETKHKVIYPYHMKEDVRLPFIQSYEEKYPFLNVSKLDEIAALTQCEVVVIDKGAVPQASQPEWKPGPKWIETKIEQPIYRVFSLTRA
jgi:hypothetical protein